MSDRLHAYLDRRVPNRTEVELFLHALRLAGGIRRGFVVDSVDLWEYVPRVRA